MTFRFAIWLRVLGILLGIQFVLGIWLTLKGTFPDTTNVARVLTYRGDPELTAHMALAVVLVLLAFVITVYAFGSDAPRRLRWFALGGLLSLLAAYECGIELIQSGFANNDYSVGMLVAFFGAAAFLGLAQWTLRAGAPPAGAGPDASPVT